jgi:hypothetical protein
LFLIKTQWVDFWNNKAFSKSLTHILSKFIENFKSRNPILFICIMSKS